MGGTRKCVVLDCVNNCRNYSEDKNRKVSYHEVPSDQKQRKKWLESLLPYMDPCCHRQLFHVCGDHFEDEYFISSPSKRKILMRGAIPTIFNMKESNFVVTSSYLKDKLEFELGAEPTSQGEENETDENEESFTLIKEEIFETQEGEENEEQQCKYLFNSVKIYKENDRGEICRVCFKSATNYKKLTDTHVTRTQTYKEMMEFLKLGINYDFYPDPVICLNCILSLLNAFDFKTRCEKTEKSLHKYYSNRATSDKPTNLLIVAYGRTKNDPITSEITIEIDQSTDDKSNIDAILTDHDYDVRTADDSIPEIKEEYEEIELSVESPDDGIKEEPSTATQSQASKYKRISVWGDPPYLCDMCGRMFHNKRQCRRHLRVHRIQNEIVDNYYCDICESTYSNVNVAMHVDSHRMKKYECQLCERRFDKRNLLFNHIQGAHEKSPYASCEVCGKRCLRKHLTVHVARHFEKKDAKCHICDKLVFKYMLKQHVKSHIQPRNRSVCHICGKSVANYLMKSHLWRHSENPKHRCTVCEVGFFSEKELQAHSLRKKHIRNLMLYEVTRKEREVS